MAKNIALAVVGFLASIGLSLLIAIEGPEMLGVDEAAPGQAVSVKEVVVAAIPDPDFYAPISDLVELMPPPESSSIAPACTLYRVELPPPLDAKPERRQP